MTALDLNPAINRLSTQLVDLERKIGEQRERIASIPRLRNERVGQLLRNLAVELECDRVRGRQVGQRRPGVRDRLRPLFFGHRPVNDPDSAAVAELLGDVLRELRQLRIALEVPRRTTKVRPSVDERCHSSLHSSVADTPEGTAASGSPDPGAPFGGRS
jgi:hypothetical protein